MKKELDRAKSIGDIFSLVKQVVRQSLGQEQAGLLVALSDLGAAPGQLIGAFYHIAANTIVINKRPLETIPLDRWNTYLFHVLLHEYLHSLGYQDEMQVQDLVEQITRQHIGVDVPTDLSSFMPYVVFGEPRNLRIDYISGIDRSNTDYIL